MTKGGPLDTGDTQMSTLKRAFVALEEAERRLAESEARHREPIAVIGLGCRTPGADGPDALWRLLIEGRDAIGTAPADRWDHDALYDPEPGKPGCVSTRFGGFVDDVFGFDAEFFGLAAREAAGMDPQQRLLLEVAWEALEHAAQPPDALTGSRTGVYLGAAGADYAYMQIASGDRGLLNPHFASGIAHSVLAGRLSYLLGLQGPSLTVDTACSSSLVSVHLACQALRARECRLALAGGVNLILSPDIFIALSQARMLSPDGRCKAFSAAADGFGRAEGCGLVVLKRLSDAEADGDRVLAVVRGGAVNQDGASAGLTAPNGPAQEAVIRAALDRAGIRPGDVGFVETHGTGTELGDPIEARALQTVFGGGRAAPLRLGAVKSNLGHLEAAAGVTGLIKLVLALHHRSIPPNLHATPPNPLIDWSSGLLDVPTARLDWAPLSDRWIGGVSSFGFSGTNAHLVVEAAAGADAERGGPHRRPQIIALSAASEAKALPALARRHAEAIGTADLSDYGRTVNAGRAQLPMRATIVAREPREAETALAALANGGAAPGLRSGGTPRHDPPRVAFLFTGQGAQHAGMGRGAYETEPVFRDAFDRCAGVLDPLLDRPLHETTFGDGAAIDATANAQPALFALEWALAELWRSWGITPDIVLGHSLGELVAATVAGVFGLDDALRLVAARGRLMQALPAGGAMASLALPEADAAALLSDQFAHLSDRLAIAGINGETQTVISGAEDAVRAVTAAAEADGHAARPLSVSHAFHSPLMEPALDAFEAAAAGIVMRPPSLRLISNVTGRRAGADVASAAYWRTHARRPVRFADCARTLADMKPGLVIEIGPQPTLGPMVRAAVGQTPVTGSLRKGTDDREALLDALSSAFLSGARIDWRAVADPDARIVDAPTYPFQRRRHWFTARRARREGGRSTGHPLLGARLNLGVSDRTVYEKTLAATDFGFIADHVVGGRRIAPGAALIEMAVAAGTAALGRPQALRDCILAEPLAFADDAERSVHVTVRDDGRAPSFEIRSGEADGETWLTHAEGGFTDVAGVPEDAVASTAPNPPAGAERIDAEAHYRALAGRGLTFGPALRAVVHVDRDPRGGAAVGLVEDLGEDAGHLLDPGTLDACLQVVAGALPTHVPADACYVPFTVERAALLRRPSGPLTVLAEVEEEAAGAGLRASVSVWDAEGPVATVAGLGMRPLGGTDADPFYQVEWQPLETGSHLPRPAALAASMDGAIEALSETHDLGGYTAANPALDARAAAAIRAAFRRLGWRPEPGESETTASIVERLGVDDRFRGAVARYLEILAEDGLLERQGDGWAVIMPFADAPEPSLPPGAEDQVRLALIEDCGRSLPEILRGERNAVEDLFAKGDVTRLRSLYRDAPEARVFNGLVARAVAEAARMSGASRPLRILEVGAGSGGTTAAVLEALRPHPHEYVFTDVSPSLVAAARTQFGAHGTVEFQTVDLEEEAGGQPFGGGGFDIVIAANCVHATRDLIATLGRIRRALAPGGTLLLVETTGKERWVDVTFGLTEGWWHFADTALRRDGPLLPREAWLDVLDGAGFDASVLHEPHPGSMQAVIAAQRTGVAGSATAVAILSDDGTADLEGAVADAFRSAGHEVHLDPSDAALREVAAAAGIVLDLRPTTLRAAGDDPQPVLARLLELTRALSDTSAAPERLVAVTHGAQTVAATDRPIPPAAAAWGFMRALTEEMPDLGPTVIDLDPSAEPAAQARALVSALAEAGGEAQIALRGTRRFGARLAPVSLPERRDAMRLVKAPTGVLEEMRLEPADRPAPGPGEVELRVLAAGLNLRDVLNALDMRDDPEPLGSECAGRIARVGAGVTGFAPGDRVVAIAEGCFADYVLARASEVVPLPDALGPVDAATLPFAYMTALRALRDAGGLRAGEKVLIHAAAGGVGSAAMEIARDAGAELYATAGSPAKRALLRARGASYVGSSRDAAFAEEILRATGGTGVDLALNSLAGPLIEATVRCLSPEGRLLEIGKRDILDDAAFHALRPGGRYHVVDLAKLRAEAPDASAKLFRETMNAAAAGRLPALPSVHVPLERGAEAFAHMARAGHVGKIVLTAADREGADLANVRPDATYLVTGGLRGLGLTTARHLAERGARHLVLVGRGAPDAAGEAGIAALRATGAEVAVERMDIGDAEAVGRLVARLAEGPAPLRGVIHAAGALRDASVSRMTAADLAVPLRAKVAGAWALHEHTAQMPLDVFVLYSSVAGTLGSRGQVNHAAANAYMDALAGYRRSLGLPALSIGWGAWSAVGIAADQDVDRRLEAEGVEAIAPEAGLAMLDAASRSGLPHVVACPIRWPDYLARRADRPMARFLERVSRPSGETDAARPARRGQVGVVSPEDLAALPAGRRRDRLLDFVTEQVVATLGAAGTYAIEVDRPLRELGLDSLMAVDLRNKLSSCLPAGEGLPATLVFEHPTVTALAAYLDARLAPVPAPAGPAPDRGGKSLSSKIDLETMTEEEIEALFASETGDGK